MRNYSKKRPSVKAHEGAAQLGRVLLDPESLLVGVALVAVLRPLAPAIDEVLENLAPTRARLNVCNHSSSSARSAVKGSNWWVHLWHGRYLRCPGMICLGFRIIPLSAWHSGQCTHSS